MPQPATMAAARKRRARELDRRLRAQAVLRAASATALYAAARLGDGAGRAELFEIAGELEGAARALRQVAPLTRGARRQIAAELVAAGVSRREIARVLGVTESCLWGDLHR